MRNPIAQSGYVKTRYIFPTQHLHTYPSSRTPPNFSPLISTDPYSQHTKKCASTMASAGGNIFHRDYLSSLGQNFAHLHSHSQLLAGIAGITLLAGLSQLFTQGSDEEPGLLRSLLLFAWNCFVKPHAEDGTGQQGHLESFYANQAGIYDRTRKGLLKGREDMLALVAAQLKFAREKGDRKRIWVDVCFPFAVR